MTMHINKTWLLLALTILLLVPGVYAADSMNNKVSSVIAVDEIERNIDPVTFSKGRRLFMQNCARCHGKQGEGDKSWRTPDESGKNPAPPLNGTGHTWHHSPDALRSVIKNGTGNIGGNMPAWKEKLSEEEITLILGWITAQWPDEIYTAWYNRFHQNQ